MRLRQPWRTGKDEGRAGDAEGGRRRAGDAHGALHAVGDVHVLYEHPQSVVFLDDCDAMFRNLPALGILRSACGKARRGTGS